MPRNRKYFHNNTTLFITSRTEEGLPLVPTHNLNQIIWGILGRAKNLFQIKICHFIFMSNHFHMLIVVDNPEDVSNFIGYVKAEIAHRVNRLLGREQKTIWAKGYDSPIVLTRKDVLRYINYIYANPTRANLVESIEDYPGVSSWEMFRKNIKVNKCKYIVRDSVHALEFPALSINEQKKLVAQSMSSKITYKEEIFELEPFAWMECFSSSQSEEQIRKHIISTIKVSETRLNKVRKTRKKDIIGATTLRRQSMLKEHRPKKRSKRMICISSDLKLRSRFIEYFRYLSNFAANVFKKWKLGRTDVRIPPGILSPRMPILVSDLTSIS